MCKGYKIDGTKNVKIKKNLPDQDSMKANSNLPLAKSTLENLYVLEKDFLRHLSDTSALAENKRRTE